MPFTLGTFIVNVLGCFILGLIYGLAEQGCSIDKDLKSFLCVGFCGGFTTFSTFSYEGMAMIRQGSYGTFALYAAASVSICIAAAFAGNYTAAFFPNAK